MIDQFTIRDAKSLLQDTDGLRVSLYAPMQVAGQQVRQNPIRFKNALSAIDKMLEDAGSDAGQRKNIADQLEPLVDDAEFWQHQGTGLAVFASPEQHRMFRVNVDLEQMVYAGKQYQILPLLELFTDNDHYHLLALSQNNVRLFRGNRNGIEQLVLPDEFPRSLTDVVGKQHEEQHLQHHSGQGSTSSPVYHGQGGGKDDENPELKQFCRAVATGLETAINASGTPLILAGDAALLAIFQRDADGKIEFSKETLSGNFDDAKPESIYEKAEQVVQRLQKAKGRIAAERYQERAAMEQGSDIFDTIVAAAREGRVDTLLIREMGGDPADKGPESVVPSAHKCNELVALCLEHGGNIEVLDNEIMPTEARIAAIYRY